VAIPILALVAISSTPAFAAIEDHVCWTGGLHLGVPCGLSADIAGVVGSVDPTASTTEVEGAVVLAEAGNSGGKLALGYAWFEGRANGPFVRERWDQWSTEGFLWPHRGFSVRAATFETWAWAGFGLLPEKLRYAGVEAELINSAEDVDVVGGLYGVNFTVGVFRRIDDRDELEALQPIFDDWMVTASVGIGF
jgi:hypothetical protein